MCKVLHYSDVIVFFVNEISQTDAVGLDRECRLFLFCKETLKALNIFFFFPYFICCHLLVMHRSVIFTDNLQIEQPGS